MAKEIRINVRADRATKERLRRALKVVGKHATETEFVMACVEALCDYIEKHGEITLPLTVLPKSQLKKNSDEKHRRLNSPSIESLRLNEPPSTEYRLKKK